MTYRELNGLDVEQASDLRWPVQRASCRHVAVAGSGGGSVENEFDVFSLKIWHLLARVL